VEQATLSLAREGASDRMLAVDLRRADIESALESADDGKVELLLDIAAREADGGSVERHALTVDCTIADLERMLESSADTIRVGFDAEALARAIREPDIEAHGLREKMAVLAVVVATTGSVVGSAQAMPTHVQGGGTGTVITDVRDMPGDSMIASQSLGEHAGQMASPAIISAAQAAQPSGGTAVHDSAADTLAASAAASQSGAPVHDMAADTLSASAAASQSGAPVHDMAADTLSASAAASQSGAPVHDMAADTLSASAAASQSGAPVHDMAADTLSASAAASQSGAPVHDMAADSLAASSGPAAAPVRDLPGEAARSVAAGEPVVVARDFPAEAATGQPVLADSSKAPPASSQGSSGIDLPAIDGTQFVVVGAIALALIGAAFAATGVNRRTPKPS